MKQNSPEIVQLVFFFLFFGMEGNHKTIGLTFEMHTSILVTHTVTRAQIYSGVRCCVWIRGQVEVPCSHLKVIKSPLLIF